MAFQRKPLDQTGSAQIRLFKFQKLSGIDRRIEITLFHRDLADTSQAENFTAISYAWSDCDEKLGIFVSDGVTGFGGYLMVTRSLWSCLDMLKKRDEKDGVARWYWIDQICINQECHRDRSIQVNLMPEIYSSAELVIMYLGIFQGWYATTLRRLVKQVKHRPRSQPPESLASDIASCAYWSRLWVRQEVFLARKALLLADNEYFDWTDIAQHVKSWESSLGATWNGARRRQLKGFHAMSQHPPVALPLPQRSSSSDKTGGHDMQYLTWSQAASLARDTECSEMKDKAFGLLGCIIPAHRIVADYDMSVDDVWHSILSVMLSKLPRLNNPTMEQACKHIAEHAKAMIDWRVELKSTLTYDHCTQKIWRGLLIVLGWDVNSDVEETVTQIIKAQVLLSFFFRVLISDRMRQTLSLSQDEYTYIEAWVLRQSEIVRGCGLYGDVPLAEACTMFQDDPGSVYDLCRRSSLVMGNPFRAAKSGNTNISANDYPNPQIDDKDLRK